MSPVSTQTTPPIATSLVEAPNIKSPEVQTTQPTSRACKTEPPKGFVVLKEKIPTLRLQIKYATTDNFTGAILPGYEAADAWLLEEPANALSKVQESLKEKNLGLVIFDAYRPKRASQAMVDWAKETKQQWVLTQGYVASKSTHNTGTTVDLGLIDLTTKQLIDMGTPFDFFGTESHTRSAKGELLENRLLLQRAMKREGFSPYTKEWWHFSYSLPEAAALDMSYQCK
jgi:zinc D-Ala-D-Ala dipeptidase